MEPIHKKCTCIALNHPLHKRGECDEPAPATGEGVCLTCRFATSPVKEPIAGVSD